MARVRPAVIMAAWSLIVMILVAPVTLALLSLVVVPTVVVFSHFKDVCFCEKILNCRLTAKSNNLKRKSPLILHTKMDE